MAADEKWYFTKEQLANTPSRKCGIDADKELSYRQQASNFIQDMGQKLKVKQLCINTAIVYMHRFYVFHSLSQFHRNSIAAAALFLAAKVEEQPRKLEDVIQVAHICLHTPPPKPKTDPYLKEAQELVFNENVLLQTLGFDVAIDHPHTHVVRCCHLVKASKDLAQTSYFMASNSLHLTTMCLQYKPTVVACFCIHLACKWSNWEIPQSNEGKDWFWYVDKTVTWELLHQLTVEFLHIFDKCSSRLRKIMSDANQSPNLNHSSLSNSPFDNEPSKIQSPANDDGLTFQSNRPHHTDKSDEKKSSSGRHSFDYRFYKDKEKKERERLEREKANSSTGNIPVSHLSDPNRHHSHHHNKQMTNVAVPNKHSLNSSSGAMKTSIHHNHHHNRQDLKNSSQRHSTSSNSNISSNSNQLRDPNRDPTRQRISSRDHNNTNSNLSHNSSLLDSSQSDLSLESFAHVSSQDKHANNHANKHQRAYDPRHNKLAGTEHRKDEVKPYGKYQRKVDTVEQRNEEVRKLIEKPAPIPKPRAEIIKEEFAAMMLKQSHNPKYNHPDKPMNNSAKSVNDTKVLNVGQTAFTTEKSPNAPVSASQISQKSLIPSNKNPSSHSSLGKISQILKDNNSVKNDNSQALSSSLLLNNLDDQKTEKRARYNEMDAMSSDSHQHSSGNSLPAKQRSLFSPEKTPSTTNRDSLYKTKSKLKTSPITFKSQQQLPNLMGSPETPQPQQQDSYMNKRPNSNTNTLLQKRLPTSSTMSTAPPITTNPDIHSRKFMSGFNINEPTETKDNILPISKSQLPILDMKPTELIEPFENKHQLTNGIDNMSSIKQEYPITNYNLKSEMSDMLVFSKHELPELDDTFGNMGSQDFFLSDSLKTDSLDLDTEPSRLDGFSPLKSAQSISSLLQESVQAPIIPSLLQNYENPAGTAKIMESQEVEEQQSQQYKQKTLTENAPINESQETAQAADLSSVNQIISTVDLSALSEPIQCPVDVTIPEATTEKQISSDQSHHHRSKSEKKKKKEKHKHKDKDKSKEKHKHKHKDKDKEKHHNRSSLSESSKEKEKNKTDQEEVQQNFPSSQQSSSITNPIKIKIPKERINMTTAASTPDPSPVSIGTAGSGLKIKISKERLVGNEVNPGIKLKIRTLAEPANTLQSTSQENRKRDRSSSDLTSNTGSSYAPPAKKSSQQSSSTAATAAVTNVTTASNNLQRQNGRHYSLQNMNNKVRGGSLRGVRHFGPRSQLLQPQAQHFGSYYPPMDPFMPPVLNHHHPSHPDPMAAAPHNFYYHQPNTGYNVYDATPTTASAASFFYPYQQPRAPHQYPMYPSGPPPSYSQCQMSNNNEAPPLPSDPPPPPPPPPE